MDILVIVVNYYSASLTQKAVSSINDNAINFNIQVVVVDNSEDISEYKSLKAILPSRVHIINLKKNLGFAKACNIAYDSYNSRSILLLNPDAMLLPGALEHLHNALWALPDAGAVGPQIFWDSNQLFYLPPSYPPNLFLFRELFQLYNPDQICTKLISLFWRQFALRAWKAINPLKVPALSGGHMLIKRKAIEATGEEFFDSRFFMYFEDTDLCKRLNRSGFKLYIVPKAHVVHSFDQCGGETAKRLKNTFMQESWTKYQQKHMSSLNRKLQSRFKKIHNQKPYHHMTTYEYKAPFVLRVPRHYQKGWIFEWSPNPDFVPAAGTFGVDEQFEFSNDLWKILTPGTYFGRLGLNSFLKPQFLNVSWTKE